MKGTLPYVYFEGAVVPAEEAQISIASHSLQYGMTCFGGIRGYFRDGNLQVFRLADHHQRLMNGAKILGMDYYMPLDQFSEIIAQLVRANHFEGDVYFRPFIYSATQRLAPRMPGLAFDLAIYMVELGNYFDPNRGLNLCVSSWFKFSDSQMPTKAKAGGCYINSAMASTEALRGGYDDALMQDQNGYIVEGSVANILMVYRDRLLTPPPGQSLLEGITLRTMIDLLGDEGKQVAFEPICRSMIYASQELMMVGTAAQVTYVASVDGRPIGPLGASVSEKTLAPGPVCLLLRDKFAQVIAGKHDRSAEWMTTFPLTDRIMRKKT